MVLTVDTQVLAAREAASSAAVRSMFAQDEALLQHTPYVADVAKVLLAGKLAEGELGFGEIDTMPPHLRTSASHTQASSGIAKAAGADQGGREESKLAAVVESRRKVGTNQNYSPATAVDLSALNLGAGDESKVRWRWPAMLCAVCSLTPVRAFRRRGRMTKHLKC